MNIANIRAYNISVESNSKPWKIFLCILIEALVRLQRVYSLILILMILVDLTKQQFTLLNLVKYYVFAVLIIWFLLAIHEFGHAAIAIAESKGLVQVSIRYYTWGLWQAISTDCIFGIPASPSIQYRYFAGGPIAMATFGCVFLVIFIHLGLVLGVFESSKPRIYFLPILLPITMAIRFKWADINGNDDFSRMKRLSRHGLDTVKEIIYVFKCIIGYIFGMSEVISYQCLLNKKPVKIISRWNENYVFSGLPHIGENSKIWAMIDSSTTIGEIIQHFGSSALSSLFIMLNHRLIKLEDK